MELHIGIDDTDSIDGMCTTYIGALLKDELSRFSKVVESRLVRLNPNIEFKTRGNAGVALRIETSQPERAKALVLKTVKKYAVLKDRETNPGVVFFEARVPEGFHDIYRRALHEVVPIEDAEKTALKYGAEVHKFKNGRGIVGALASIGSDLADHTYEIIAYRHSDRWGTKRGVDRESVMKMNEKTFPLTFNNIDHTDGSVLITPRSPCPALFGIRGENPDVLARAYKMVVPEEKIERNALYTTNQGTDAHLEKVNGIVDITPYSSVILGGAVASEPKTIEGGHVIFSLFDGTDTIDCAAYEPTGDFRNVVRELKVGDEIEVAGGVKSSTLNMEKMEVLNLAEISSEENPTCPSCKTRMKSAGKHQGFRCKRCKTKADNKVERRINRKLEKKTYQVPPGAMRHLSKPLVRY